MARFSQRYGFNQVRQVIQVESMDDDLRNSLWNALHLHYWGALDATPQAYLRRHIRTSSDQPIPSSENTRILFRRIWVDFFKRLRDEIPEDWESAKDELYDFFFSDAEWYEIYDFVEFVAQNDRAPERVPRFQRAVNRYLARESSGYRFMGDSIVPIVSETEISEIESAITGKEQAVSSQLKRSLELLSDRADPDYRNSIKESISAVEGQVMSTLGAEKGTLGTLLNQLEQQAPVHPALKEAFSKLYGYTSDESGIRHALLDDGREVTFEEAKFMLVVCSAFINYVRGITKS